MKTVKLILFLLLLLLLISCAKPKQVEWTCIADVNRDSKCQIIPCADAQSLCSRGNYRIMKIYPIKQVYIYSVEKDHQTDMQTCTENIKDKIK